VNRKKLGAVGALIAAFALGAVAGGFGMRGHVLGGFAKRMHGPPGRARMEFRLEAMTRQLDLSPDQRDRIQKIFDAHEDERRNAFDRCAPELKTLQEKVDEEIRAVLTPEQRAKHDQMTRGPRDRRRGRGR